MPKYRRLPDFGKKLVATREARGWSQKELARRLGYTPVGLCLLETGKQNCTLPVLIDLCNLLDVSAEWLLSLSPGTPEEQALYGEREEATQEG